MKPIPKAIIKDAIRLMSEGISTRETACRLNISQSMASRIYSSNKEKMPVNKVCQPRKLQAETTEYLKVNFKRGYLKTAKEARDKANDLLPASVSTSTIRRQLREAGLIAKRKIKRPALQPHYIYGRKIFVRKYKEWTINDWKHVVGRTSPRSTGFALMIFNGSGMIFQKH
jgi:transposase